MEVYYDYGGWGKDLGGKIVLSMKNYTFAT